VIRLLCVAAIVWLAGCSAAPRDPANDPALARGAILASVCSGCHASSGTAIVSLDGYTSERIEALVTTYRVEGASVMHRMVRGYTDAEIDSIAGYLGTP
jgi:cytochrome subunit of sulfide dehydrogenase